MVKQMRRSNKLIYGKGVNDADYVVKPTINGIRSYCGFYTVWHHMLARCYSEYIHKKQPSYKDCTCCKEWLIFSKFKAWMETQDWQGKELDKDILFKGNKHYSPETCVFVNKSVNTFIIDRSLDRGDYMIGVSKCKLTGKYYSSCSNPLTKKRGGIGKFKTEIEAHLAWKKRKHEFACMLADQQSDERVAEALRNRYV